MNIEQFRRSWNNEQTRWNDLSALAGQVVGVPGRAQINGAGEATFDIPFSIKFTELPNFVCGFETLEGQAVIAGQKPTGTGYVSAWKTVERLPFGVYYTGATVVAVITGPSTTKMIMNYNFTGKALSNPSVE